VAPLAWLPPSVDRRARLGRAWLTVPGQRYGTTAHDRQGGAAVAGPPWRITPDGYAAWPATSWSGRRDSNPRPSPWQGDALPTEPLPPETFRPPHGGAESQNRTGDTAIFSRVLYQLSYLGPKVNQPSAARRRVGEYHGPRAPSNRGGAPPAVAIRRGEDA